MIELVQKENVLNEEMEKLREELLDGELADDLYEYVLGTSDYVCEMVGQEANNIVNDCKNIGELKNLKQAVSEYQEEKQKVKPNRFTETIDNISSAMKKLGFVEVGEHYSQGEQILNYKNQYDIKVSISIE